MANRVIINKIKTDLRIKHSALDEDISDNIDSCMADLNLIGVKSENALDANIANAIKLWCRANYAQNTEDAEAYMRRYNALKGTLQMSVKYRGDINADE